LLCQAAALGDYEQADAALHTILDGMGKGYLLPILSSIVRDAALDTNRDGTGGPKFAEALRVLRRDISRLLIREVFLAASRPSWMARHRMQVERVLMTKLLADTSFMAAEQADLHVLAGMLFLERGEPQSAEQSFRTAHEQSRLSAGIVPPSTGQLLADAYLRVLQAARR
jgi:hypothetical protein